MTTPLSAHHRRLVRESLHTINRELDRLGFVLRPYDDALWNYVKHMRGEVKEMASKTGVRG